MPRPLDAGLLAAMNSGNFTPWFKVQLMDVDRSTVLFETTDVIGFQLDGLTVKVEFYDPAYSQGYTTFRICRGISVAGTPNYISSSNYWPILDRHDKRIRTLEGHVFPLSFYSTPGDVTYSSIINTVCAHFNFSVVQADPAAAWLSYQFYPAGRTLSLGDAKRFFTILRQKYLIFATDYGNDTLYFYQAKNTAPSFPSEYTLVAAGEVASPGNGALKYKSFISRDEAMTVHTSGAVNAPKHNLGFLHSTASQPDRSSFIDTLDWIFKAIPPNLKYLDFDAIYDDFDILEQIIWPAKFREVFDKKLHPMWQWQARFLDVFGPTEAGAIPATIEAAAPYTPVNTGYFNKVLSATDNNVQACMDTIDDHAHTGELEPYDADLHDIAGLGLTADKMIYTQGVHDWTTTPLTAAARSLLDDAAVSNMRTTLGLDAGGAGDIWVQRVGDTMTATLVINPAAGNYAINVGGTFDGSINYALYVHSVMPGTTSNKGLYFTVSQTTIASNGFYGIDARPVFQCTSGGPQVNFYGLLGIPIIHSTTMSAVTNSYGGYFRTENQSTSGSVLTNSYNVYISNAVGPGSITNVYGLYIASIVTVGTNNWAIYTNSGKVYLGDDAQVHGDLTVDGLANVTGKIKTSGGMIVNGDPGGLAGALSFSNSLSGTSSGTGTPKMAGTTSRNSDGWIKIYPGASAAYIPFWNTITG